MRRRALLAVVAAVALAAGGAVTGVGGTASAGSGPCARFGPMVESGTVADSRIVELSGLAASRRHPGVLWAHNDSSGEAEVFALGLDGRALGAYPIGGATAFDWEDMAIGPGLLSGSFLYLGDIGDNAEARSSVVVYRVPEPTARPSGPGAPIASAEKIELRYPGGPANAETLLIDPRNGDLVIVTKTFSGTSRVLVAPAASLHAGPPVMMSDAGTIQVPLPPGGSSGLPATMVTGGAVSPDGSTVALRTYGSVLLYARGNGSIAAALKGTPCFGPQEDERQGEAVTFTNDGRSLVTISEGSRQRVFRSGAPGTATTTTTSGGAGPSTGPGDDDGGEGTSTTAPDATTTTVDGSSTTTIAASGDDPSVAGDVVIDEPDRRPAIVAATVLVAAVAGLNLWARRRRRSAAG